MPIRYTGLVLLVSLVATLNSVAQQCTVMQVDYVHLQGSTVWSDSDIERLVRSVTLKNIDLREVSKQLQRAYQDFGYYKAQVHDPEVQVKAQGIDGKCHFDVLVVVNEGNVYRIGEIRFKGGTIFPAAKYRELFSLEPGDVFNRSAIEVGLVTLRKLYCDAGYINFSSVPDVNFDEQSSLISLEIDMDEGKQFRWGMLAVDGKNSVPGAKRRLLDFWKPHEGTTYDCGRTIQLFLREIGSRPDVRPEQVFRTSLDNNAGVVNVGITLADPPIF